ncbi:MAG: hypothetical protein JRE64_20705 [Deltaproteobacteria bacterium]|nr:hypothetical protein [Deltaproteobacteria bacterium]
MKTHRIQLFTIALMLIGSTVGSMSANAAFLGETVRLQGFFPNLNNPISVPFDAVVGSGVEFHELDTGGLPGYIVADVEVDVTNNSITWDFVNTGGFTTFPSAEFNGHVLTDINDTIPAITDVTIDAASTTFSLDPSRVFFNVDQVFFNVEGLSIDQGNLVKVNVEFVPLPAAIWFFLSGVLVLGASSGRLSKRYR